MGRSQRTGGTHERREETSLLVRGRGNDHDEHRRRRGVAGGGDRGGEEPRGAVALPPVLPRRQRLVEKVRGARLRSMHDAAGRRLRRQRGVRSRPRQEGGLGATMSMVSESYSTLMYWAHYSLLKDAPSAPYAREKVQAGLAEALAKGEREAEPDLVETFSRLHSMI